MHIAGWSGGRRIVDAVAPAPSSDGGLCARWPAVAGQLDG